MPRTWILYHVKDLDGHCAGSIAKYYYKNVIGTMPNMVPFDYGYELPSEISDRDRLVFVDIAPIPYKKTYELINTRKDNGEVIIIDHHKSYIDFLGNNQPKGIQVVGKSGCELAWEYFINGESSKYMMPDFVKLLGRYDVWDNSSKKKWEEEILPFQYGMRAENTDPKDDCYLDKLIKDYLSVSWSDRLDEQRDIKKAGKYILKYQEKQNSKNLDLFSFDAEFDGYKAICFNNPVANSGVFKSKWDPQKYDIMLNYVFDGEKYTISIYTDKEGIECQEIAKKFGGGGHIQAAGFTAKDIIVENGQFKVKT
jgi:oligoribonuclease NrnB/cAMP/cGMP phosphodiesterase (DHH superfamily)